MITLITLFTFEKKTEQEQYERLAKKYIAKRDEIVKDPRNYYLFEDIREAYGSVEAGGQQAHRLHLADVPKRLGVRDTVEAVEQLHLCGVLSLIAPATIEGVNTRHFERCPINGMLAILYGAMRYEAVTKRMPGGKKDWREEYDHVTEESPLPPGGLFSRMLSEEMKRSIAKKQEKKDFISWVHRGNRLKQHYYPLVEHVPEYAAMLDERMPKKVEELCYVMEYREEWYDKLAEGLKGPFDEELKVAFSTDEWVDWFSTLFPASQGTITPDGRGIVEIVLKFKDLPVDKKDIWLRFYHEGVKKKKEGPNIERDGEGGIWIGV